MFYDDHHVVFYIHSSTMMRLKFLWNVKSLLIFVNSFFIRVYTGTYTTRF
ncbi:hypothetical protein Hanom_Chr14g01321931 [Helianthus anomalus]